MPRGTGVFHPNWGVHVKATPVFAFFAVAALAAAACNGDSTGPSQSENNDPEIVGCNSVKYKGTTFSNIGCAPGIASFDVAINQNNVMANFRITCSGGCVATVTVI